MSPEQARGGSVGQRGEIFSFGVVPYELLAGAPPFRCASSLDVLDAVLHAPTRALPLKGLRPRVL